MGVICESKAGVKSQSSFVSSLGQRYVEQSPFGSSRKDTLKRQQEIKEKHQQEQRLVQTPADSELSASGSKIQVAKTKKIMNIMSAGIK